MTETAGLPQANLRGRRRALACAVIALLLAVVCGVLAVLAPGPVSLLAVVVAVVAAGLCAVMWVAYGWTTSTPGRVAWVRVGHYGPFVASVVAIAVLMGVTSAAPTDARATWALWLGFAAMMPAIYAAFRR